MNPLHIVQGFDPELYDYFETELEHQHYSLSFIPDENCISPSCSAMMGSVLINSAHQAAFKINTDLEQIVKDRLCKLFGAEHANISTITIEAASRVVFQALTQRGDVIMSLDLRKREHCNSESLVYRFINFGLDPKSEKLDMDLIEKEVMANKPRMIILSPINYPMLIDYERFAKIAHDAGALLWCDISQVAGLVSSGTMPSPVPYADVVTFTVNGALQGPRSSVILCKQQFASSIDRMCISSGHRGLGSVELSALSLRLKEMETENFVNYAKAVKENAKALAEGLKAGGMRLICDGTESHLVIVDDKKCAMSARGALEGLAECGVLVRTCEVLTADPNVKFDGIRFSTMPVTTRGLKPNKFRQVGETIARYLCSPTKSNEKVLKDLVQDITVILPLFSTDWMHRDMFNNLDSVHMLSTNAEVVKSRLSDSHDIVRRGKTGFFSAFRALHHHGDKDKS